MFNKENFNKQEVWRLLENKPGSWYQEAGEAEREAMRDWVKGMLKDNKITVDFVKADGSMRHMTCTLSEELGAQYVNKTLNEDAGKKPNIDTCVVWDCNANGWRSFRWDRLKRIEFKIG